VQWCRATPALDQVPIEMCNDEKVYRLLQRDAPRSRAAAFVPSREITRYKARI